MNLKNYKLHVISTFFIIIIFLLLIKINALTFDNHVKTKEIETLDKKYKDVLIINKDLEEEIKEKDLNYLNLDKNYREEIKLSKNLKTQISLLENKNTSLLDDYEKIKEEYQYIKDDLLNFKKSINESMDWFGDNSTIDILKESESMKKELLKCIDCESSKCYIKTTCIHAFVNKEEYNIKYIPDKETSNINDKLQNLQSFMDNKGGDCEDFSLLFTAQLRHLIDYSLEKGKDPIIESAIESLNNNYFVYQNWYYSDFKEYRLGKDYIYPYVVCGNLFDLQEGEYGGHCVVLLSKNKINSYQDISLLDDSYLIEPQFGDFIDKVKYNGILKEENNNGMIYYVISENDFYIHSSVLKASNSLENEWYSYNYYLEKINFLEEEYN